jgi:hypothetical protein
VIQALSGFVAAAVGWLTLEFLGRPLRKFFDLRGETVELLTRIANVRAAYTEFHDEISERVVFPRRETSGSELKNWKHFRQPLLRCLGRDGPQDLSP